VFPNPPAGLQLKSIEIGGVDVTDLPFEVNGNISDVVMTLIDAQPASVTGTVKGLTPRDQLTTLVFPSDQRLWADPEAAFRRFKSAPVGRDGTFTAAQLPPGDYLLALVSDLDAVDWQEQSRIEVLARTAQHVTVLDGEKKVVEVKR
jgi:hypothetical protein